MNSAVRAILRVAHPGFTLDVDLALPGRGVTAQELEDDIMTILLNGLAKH